MANAAVGPSERSIGRSPGLPILFLLLVIVLPAHAGSPWRIWNKADGLAESWTFGLSLDGKGRVVAKHGDVAIESVLDGYQIAGIPSRHAFGRLLASPEKELWTFDAEGILIYDASGWRKYSVPEIVEFAKTSRMQRIPWFLYSISRYRTSQKDERMDVLPVGGEAGIILFPDRLVEWNRVSGLKRTIRLAAQTSLSRFVDAQEIGGRRALDNRRRKGSRISSRAGTIGLGGLKFRFRESIRISRVRSRAGEERFS